MTNIAENKSVIRSFFEDLNRSGMAQAGRNHLSQDARWMVIDWGESDFDGFVAMAEGLPPLFEEQLRLEVGQVTAEEDRVAVEAESFAKLKDGRLYQNTYHFLFTLKDGKIVRVREHNNTRHAHETFDPVP